MHQRPCSGRRQGRSWLCFRTTAGATSRMRVHQVMTPVSIGGSPRGPGRRRTGPPGLIPCNASSVGPSSVWDAAVERMVATARRQALGCPRSPLLYEGGVTRTAIRLWRRGRNRTGFSPWTIAMCPWCRDTSACASPIATRPRTMSAPSSWPRSRRYARFGARAHSPCGPSRDPVFMTTSGQTGRHAQVVGPSPFRRLRGVGRPLCGSTLWC